MICLLHYWFHLHLLANFTQTLPSIRSEKQTVVKPDRPHLFSWTYIFSRMLQHVIKSHSTEIKTMGGNNDCNPPTSPPPPPPPTITCKQNWELHGVLAMMPKTFGVTSKWSWWGWGEGEGESVLRDIKMKLTGVGGSILDDIKMKLTGVGGSILDDIKMKLGGRGSEGRTVWATSECSWWELGKGGGGGGGGVLRGHNAVWIMSSWNNC